MVITRSHTYGPDAPAPYLDIPTYTLNLDLPPRERWKHIITHYPHLNTQVLSVISQFLDETVPGFTKPLAKLLMASTLSRLASDELTEELEGIAEVSGTPMWALVAENIAYDYMAGCSSGGVRTVGEGGKEEMFHFRNLDWMMEETRQTTIQVNYTRGGKSVLEAIHYVGMVGIATGVRRGLSASLNFRARTNESTSTYTRLQQAFGTAFGKRPDATSIIREILTSEYHNIDSTIARLQHTESAPAYFILCSPSKVAIIEKDYTSAKVTTSDKFLDCANHDNDMDEWTEQEFEEWSEPTKDPLLISSRARKLVAYDASHHIKSVEDVKTMTQIWPVLNSLTTFGVIMSPERGTIDWGAWYKHRPIPPAGMEKWGGEYSPAT